MKRSVLVIVIILLGLMLFSSMRLALFMLYDYFAPLDGWQITRAFINGARFDGSVMMLAISLPILMILIAPYKPWKYFWCWVIFAIYAGFALILVVDVIYFDYARRHLGNEVRWLAGEIPFMISTARDYKFHLAGFLTTIFILGYLYSKLIRIPVKQEKRIWLKIIIFILISILMIRGTAGRKSIASIDAFRHGVIEGNLTINGIFTIYRNWVDAGVPVIYYMDNDTAIRMTGGNPDARYPLLNDFEGCDNKKNVVVLIMESWSAYYIDVIGQNGFNATPCFDALAKEGALFTRHFAAEKRTIDGVQAIVTGIPPIRSIGSLGYGLEVRANGNLGDIARLNGYETIMMHTSRRRSYYMDAVANGLGFDFFGSEDIPIVMDYPDPQAPVYGWDYDGLMKLGQIIDSTSKPFIAIFMSGTTHPTYPELYPPFDKRKQANRTNLDSFLNTLEYSDYSVGEFIKKASEKEWFKDTIFIITADHASTAHSEYPDPDYAYLAPLLIYSPGNIPAAEYSHITSHLDLLPTIIELAGLKGKTSTIGRNVFRGTGRAFTGDNGLAGIITEKTSATILGNIIISSRPKSFIGESAIQEADSPEFIAARLAAAIVQTTDLLINTGRWNPASVSGTEEHTK